MPLLNLIRTLLFAFILLHAFVVQSAEFMSLGFLPGGMGSRATGISADGTVVVGWSGSDIGDQALSLIHI